ncbi:hypothetical protein GTO89_15880 [Heliobacterium gestii]|uniref:Uncharacterized protein n=1 Tax=Heliomicrobium gestii TaxID=2699 RepID=A0A845LG32_HELGE|nr:glycosyltransferase family 4 protein [Heliomicrobium gestii]MBM7868334.1 hypothetical protein [Heliomicrobium gestii]MZP44511.1 hypothetical protein [Heliomicrobium gestii]
MNFYELNEARRLLGDSRVLLGDKVAGLYTLFSTMQEKMAPMDGLERRRWGETLEKGLRLHDLGNRGEGAILRLYLTSFLLEVTGEERFLWEIFRAAEEPARPLRERLFLYWQIVRRGFLDRRYRTLENDLRFWRLHRALVHAHAKLLPEPPQWIPAAERDSERVVVITNQYLGLQHGPTMTALDRAHALQSKLGKKVVLINAAEMPRSLPLPFFLPFLATFKGNLSRIDLTRFQGQAFPFYQCKDEMPNVEEMMKILAFIKEIRPAFILSIGGNNITADLCSRIAPVATLGCVSGLAVSEGQFFLPWGDLVKEDEEKATQLGIAAERIISCDFTFYIRPQRKKLSRADLGIDEKAFVLAIVGGRLDEEVQPAYAQELDRFLEGNPEAFIAFAGHFERYEKYRAAYPSFAGQSCFAGYQDDILAFNEVCDAYLNPPRTGGGTSALEALYMGNPVFTQPRGDVAYVAGPRYHMDGFAAIETFMARWQADASFRDAERAAARLRAGELTDTAGALGGVIAAMERSDYYR